MPASLLFRTLLRSLTTSVLVAGLSVPLTAQVAETISTAAASAIIEDVDQRVTMKINQMKDAGMLLNLEVLKTLRDAIASLRTLVAEGTGQLDAVATSNIRRASSELRRTVDRVDTLSRARSEELMVTMTALNQSIADLPFAKDRQLISAFWPRAISQRQDGLVVFTALGIGLPDVRGVYLVVRGVEYAPSTNLGNRIEFSVPAGVFGHRSTSDTLIQANVVLDPAWYKVNKSFPVQIRVLPQQIAKYAITPIYSARSDSASEEIDVVGQELRGRDGWRSASYTPTRPEWRIDATSIRLRKTAGESSGNPSILGAPSEAGFSVQMWCGHSRRRPLSIQEGWGAYNVGWRQYKEVVVDSAGAPYTGNLTRATPSIALPLALTPRSIRGTVTDFTGTTYQLLPGRSTYGWVDVDLDKATRQVIVELSR